MVQEDFETVLHKFLLETESLSEVSDDMRGRLVEGGNGQELAQ